MKNILILNGSPHGKKGNCQKLIARLEKSLRGRVPVSTVHLANQKFQSTQANKRLFQKIQEARAVIFVTGTYWDSWGSPLQKLLEEMTVLEGSKALMGKPCAVFVLMHSVGGKSVLSRLQGVLSTMGFLIPPMSGMVYSLVSDLVLKNEKQESASKSATSHRKNSRSPHADDFWSLEDCELILQNLIKSLEIQVDWTSWPVDEKNFRKTWLRS